MKVKENNKNKLKYSFDKARHSNSSFNFQESVEAEYSYLSTSQDWRGSAAS